MTKNTQYQQMKYISLFLSLKHKYREEWEELRNQTQFISVKTLLPISLPIGLSHYDSSTFPFPYASTESVPSVTTSELESSWIAPCSSARVSLTPQVPTKTVCVS